MLEVFLDALKDTAYLIPFLFVAHFLIEIVEEKRLEKIEHSSLLVGGFAPLVGTGVALLPQCGFSVIASELYAQKYIKVGTLVAVFLATSDEALPILLGSAVTDTGVWVKIGLLLGIKIIIALVAGYTLNAIFVKMPESEHGELHAMHGCCGHDVGEGGKGVFQKYFKHPLIHTATVTLFVFIVNFALGSIIFLVGGEEIFANFMAQSVYFQPLFAVLVGLVPNCASSVMLTQTFLHGSLTLGATVAGLSVNAGLGLAVLFKENKNLKSNLFITCFLVAYSLIVGYVLTLLGI